SAGSGSPPPSGGTASEEVFEEGTADASGPAEERLEEIAAEDVLDVPGAREPGPIEALAAPDLLLQPVGPELIVDLPLLRIREDLPEILELLLDGLPHGFRDPRGVLLQELLRGVHELVARVPELDELAAPPVVLRVRFRVADRLVDLCLLHPMRCHDRQLLGLPSRQVLR